MELRNKVGNFLIRYAMPRKVCARVQLAQEPAQGIPPPLQQLFQIPVRKVGIMGMRRTVGPVAFIDTAGRKLVAAQDLSVLNAG